MSPMTPTRDAAKKPDRNLAMELVRVTEAAALAASRWIGRGDKNAADQAAVDAMRLMIDTVSVDGVVVIGEGEKDEAPMLFNGEKVGTGEPPAVDIAVDPIDGTRLTARGGANALSVLSMAEKGSMFDPGPCVYMEKIAAGGEAADVIDIEAPIEDNIAKVAKAKGIEVADVIVTILDRERHEEYIKRIRECGARVRLITDGDVAGAIAAGRSILGVDILYGIGGTPEGVTSACALKCLGGEIQGKLWPRNENERQRAIDEGYDLNRVLSTNDLVSGEDVFFAATGVTDGYLLDGVRTTRDGAVTESLVMRSRSGTIRTVRSEHRWDKLERISEVAYRPGTH
ncbi:MAG: class II fructose-bisphosphatase [Actinomycetota bacterium]